MGIANLINVVLFIVSLGKKLELSIALAHWRLQTQENTFFEQSAGNNSVLTHTCVFQRQLTIDQADRLVQNFRDSTLSDDSQSSRGWKQ